MLIFLPLGTDELAALRATGLDGHAAHAATPALFEALGYGPELGEDAEFAALTYASVACLTNHPRRLVAVAEVPEAGVAACEDPEGFGLVTATRVTWPQVTSLFVGDPEDAQAERAAASAAAGRALAEAWDNPAVAALVESTDLCWFAAGEADDVARALA